MFRSPAVQPVMMGIGHAGRRRMTAPDPMQPNESSSTLRKATKYNCRSRMQALLNCDYVANSYREPLDLIATHAAYKWQ